jgi:hypothetical protein
MEMSSWRIVLGIGLPAFGAWCLSASASWWGAVIPGRLDTQPHVPLVSVPAGSVTDVMSSVTGVFRVLLVVAICLLLVEIGKVNAGKYGGARLYTLLLSYQLLLALDTVRGHARDWWVWGLSKIGIVDLQTMPDWKENVIPLQSPWPSFFGLCILVMITTVMTRVHTHGGGTPSGE